MIQDLNLVLLKKNKEPISQIENIRNTRLLRNLSGVDELTFTIDKYYEHEGEKHINPLYDLLDAGMLIEINEEEIFTIVKPIEVVAEDKVLTKEIIAYSKEYELKDKLVLNFQGKDRVIYDPSNKKDKDGIYFGLLNYLEEKTNWKVSYYNTGVLKRYKDLSIDKTNMLQAILDSQEDFECLLVFNTANETIDILDIEQIGTDRGLYLSDKNFINSLKKEVNKDDIVTRLYCYGNENIDISRVNITGQPYVEDYTFFMNEDHMSKELINALKDNQKQIEKEGELWDSTFSRLLGKEKELSNQENGLRLQEGQLEQMQKNFDDNIENETEREKIHKRIKEKEVTINEMKKKRDNILKDINKIESELKTISSRVSFDNHLTKELQEELNYFIKEDVYNSSFGKYDLDKLYSQGKKMINRLSRPYIDFELDLDDFTQMVEGEDIKHLLRLGDIVNIEHFIMDEYYQVRIISYEQTEGNINITFSSKESIWSQEILIEDILADASSTTDTVDFSKFNWDKAKTVDNEFRKYIQSELNLANQGLIKAEGQRPVLDDRGLWLYKEGKDGVPLPEQIRAVNNIIAITKDNWNTVDVAITPKGVMANQLIGDVILGTDLKIISDSGVVEILENLITIRDGDGIPRVQMGQYDKNKYGLKLTDKSGRNTILDEEGMLQIWQEGRADNVDDKHGLKIQVYVPKNTRRVYDARLRYNLEEFRSYSDTTDTEEAIESTTDSGGGVYTSTGDGGEIIDSTGDGGGVYTSTGDGGEVVDTTGDGGGVYTSTGDGGEVIDTTGGGGGVYTSTGDGGKTYTSTGGGGDVLDTTGSGGGEVATAGLSTDVVYDYSWVHEGGDPKHRHKYRHVIDHQHLIPIKEHVHSIEIPEHVHTIDLDDHDHRIAIDEHAHSIEIPDHVHTIDLDNHVHSVKLPDHVHTVELDDHKHSITISDHKHSISIKEHKHEVTIPAHSHGIDPIIKTYDVVPNNTKIYINNRDRTYDLVGRSQAMGDQESLDITKYLKIGAWNIINIEADSLGRIDATVFIQALINFDYK